MMKQALLHFPLPILTCVGLVLFLGVFIGAVAWIYRRGSDDFYNALQELPFSDKEKQT